MADLDDFDVVVIPVGGGGLSSGVATAIKARRPAVSIIGVEPALYPSLSAELRGEEAKVGGATIAEGIAVKKVGNLTAEILRKLMDQVIVVSDPVGTGGDRDVLATVYIANQGTWRRIGARSAAKSDRPVDLITMRTPADGNFAFDEFVALRRPGETRTYLVAWAGARVSNGFVGYRVFEIEPAAGALVPVDKWKDDGAQLYAAFKSLSAADGRTVFDAEIESAELRLHCNSTLPAGEGLAAACAQLPR